MLFLIKKHEHRASRLLVTRFDRRLSYLLKQNLYDFQGCIVLVQKNKRKSKFYTNDIKTK